MLDDAEAEGDIEEVVVERELSAVGADRIESARARLSDDLRAQVRAGPPRTTTSEIGRELAVCKADVEDARILQIARERLVEEALRDPSCVRRPPLEIVVGPEVDQAYALAFVGRRAHQDRLSAGSP